MRHNSPVASHLPEGVSEPSTPNRPQSLNPKLKRALNCLDIQLEDELTRYRRQRSGYSVPPADGLKRKQVNKVELMSLGGAIASNASLPPAPPQIPASLTADQQSTVPNSEQNQPSQLAIAGQFVPEGTIVASDETDSSSHLSHSSQEATEDLTNSTPPDDYLESSEELLRSLAREEAQVRVERSFLESLATPLGVGSMLMLLLSSAMFGYVIMNPSSLSVVTSLFDRPQPTSAENPAPANSDSSQAAISNSPPLDKQEFVDLGLSNLTTLKSRGALPSVKPSPKATASPAATAASEAGQSKLAQPAPASSPSVPSVTIRTIPAQSAPATSSRSYSPPAPARSYSPPPARSYSPPAKPYTPPVIQTAPLLPASAPRPYSPPVQTAPPPTQSGDYSYKVEVPYTGDRSLEDARKVAPDSYLRPDGKIQLGAANSEAEAKARAQELQNQGISAEVNQR